MPVFNDTINDNLPAWNDTVLIFDKANKTSEEAEISDCGFGLGDLTRSRNAITSC